jgi:hypothetical protein
VTDEQLIKSLQAWYFPECHIVHLIETRIEQLKEKLDKAVNIATLALNALDEVQTYKSPLDPWEEDALAMRELNAFDFHVEFARADIAKLEEQHE